MDNDKERISVTKPSLPDLDEFMPYLEEIWESRWLTNNGKFHQEFEEKLANYLGVKYISLITNGTIALMIALRALRVTGEVITTPYSFVATSNVLRWQGIKPVFVDIDEETFNLDPDNVESAITPDTTAILPVHVYGNPCDHERLREIADRYNLKLIYDAAHAFGIEKNGQSILSWGDLSVLSFHATKVFNTFEGGAIISHSEEMKERVNLLKNFGFKDKETVVLLGINGKMNEFQSALGILQLDHVEDYIEKRKAIAELYKKELSSIEGITVLPNIDFSTDFKWNYIYLPILVEKEYSLTRDQLYESLTEKEIYPRKYFYPLISEFQMFNRLPSAAKENLPVANNQTRNVLCLPLHTELDNSKLERVFDVIKN